jgi:hypothetical protein
MNWIYILRRQLIGLLYQTRMIMMNVQKSVERELAGETKVLEENLPQFHFVHHKFHMNWPGSNPGLRRGKTSTNFLINRGKEMG